MAALWLRSITDGRHKGANPATLHSDITHDKPIDDNSFDVALNTIVENSFNIHREGERLVFRAEENPFAKVMAYAKNDRHFADGSDKAYLAKRLHYMLSPETSPERIVVLPSTWRTNPWGEGANISSVKDTLEPWKQDRPLLVFPEIPESFEVTLGHWLKEHFPTHRNTPRFLLPKAGESLYDDKDLLLLARATMTAQKWAQEWKNAKSTPKDTQADLVNFSKEYTQLHNGFDTKLRDELKKRFDRFAVLKQWCYSDPAQTKFECEKLTQQGAAIPKEIEEKIKRDLFVPEDFEAYLLEATNNHLSLSKVLNELREPRPNGVTCIPYLGENEIIECLARLAAKGCVAFDLGGQELLQTLPDETRDQAEKRFRSKLFQYTGRQQETIFLTPYQLVLATGGGEQDSPATHNFLPETGSTIRGTERYGVHETPSTLFSGASSKEGSWSRGSGESLTPSQQGDPTPSVPYQIEETSPLNLIGKIENWGIDKQTPLTRVVLTFTNSNGAQLSDILKKLPEDSRCTLNFEAPPCNKPS